jgi:hypothetical protein
VADKSSELVLAALGRAVADPEGLPLFGHKTSPGLFGSTAVARRAAERCKELDLLRVVGTSAQGQSVREVVAITPRGLDHLLSQSNPRQVLEDLVRALERREKQLDDLVAAARQARGNIEALKTLAVTVLEHVRQSGANAAEDAKRTASANVAATLLQLLDEWQGAHAAKDCPLPQLFRALECKIPQSIGMFHDSLRELHEQGRIYLHPWTGPLHDMPEPQFAALVGHEVAYYASLRP